MDNEALGARIRELREARRLSQPELAEMLEVSTKTISNWENGRNSPRASMGALRDVFGPELDDKESRVAVEGDMVEAALDKSGLDDWRASDVKTLYKRHWRDQRREEATG